VVEDLVHLHTPRFRRFPKSDRHLINPFVVEPFDGCGGDLETQ
jgi:hypothetical protein